MNERLLNPKPVSQNTAIIPNSPIYIYYSIFDSRNGPQFIYTTAPTEDCILHSLSLFLFPSGWKENETFAIYHDGWFCYAITVSSPNISHYRGPLHSTVALISKSIPFGQNHYEFLQEMSKVFHDLQCSTNLSDEQNIQNFVQELTHMFNFSNIFNSISDQYHISHQSEVIHPLYPFTRRSYASKLFSQCPEMLLTLWRFRLAKKRIVIACTTNISEATDLAYFIAAIGSPYCHVDKGECGFLIDLADEDYYLTGQGWLVCSVTHPLMQENIKGDVTITKNKKLHLNSSSCKYLTKGGGNVLNEIKEITVSHRGDDCLLQRMMDLTVGLLNISSNCQIIDNRVIKSIGLDKKNVDFLEDWLTKNNSTAELDLPCGC